MKNQTFIFSVDEAVEQYGDMVYRIAMTYAKNEADAWDIFQETFLRLVKYRETIESAEHLKAWLIRVTTNNAKSFVTSSWQKNTEGFDENGPEPSAEEKKEADSDVLDALHSLPEKYRIVLYLFYYEELDIKHIGRILGKKENTVKSLLSRGREMLKKQLIKKGYHL